MVGSFGEVGQLVCNTVRQKISALNPNTRAIADWIQCAENYFLNPTAALVRSQTMPRTQPRAQQADRNSHTMDR
jgi:hypothetical protein